MMNFADHLRSLFERDPHLALARLVTATSRALHSLASEDWRPLLTWAIAQDDRRTCLRLARVLAWVPSAAGHPEAFRFLAAQEDGEVLVALCVTHSVRLGLDARTLFERLSSDFPGYADLLLELLPDFPDRLAYGSGRRDEGEVSTGADRMAVA